MDLGVQFAVLEAAFRISELFTFEALFSLVPDALLVVDALVGASTLVLYTTLAEWWGGATLGKVLTGLRVVTEAGEPISAKAALIRSLAFYVDGLFLGFVAYTVMARNHRRQRLGDEWAGTVVVRKSAKTDGPVHAGWTLGASAALGVVLLSYVLAA